MNGVTCLIGPSWHADVGAGNTHSIFINHPLGTQAFKRLPEDIVKVACMHNVIS